MANLYDLSQVDEGKIFEIVSIKNEKLIKDIGICAGMTTVLLKKALQSVVQFGYSQIVMDFEELKNIQVQPI